MQRLASKPQKGHIVVCCQVCFKEMPTSKTLPMEFNAICDLCTVEAIAAHRQNKRNQQ